MVPHLAEVLGGEGAGGWAGGGGGAGGGAGGGGGGHGRVPAAVGDGEAGVAGLEEDRRNKLI